ncbi:CHAT domain-containing protein [Streptomyces sp. KM273126]|uniref:CHAT domain-containing protein n=1 Tax=Streptomyces sp. KM273126 TaxID=2545247 RepID=UPI00140442C6|nr:CHAT domain-containing protein [Streptomyces sp. KM273126]MBA2807063.1 CHAT domain-containing protein [Streptomyces sp. KM273126]
MRDESTWVRFELLTERLGERLEAFFTDGDREAVLNPAALAEAEELRAIVLLAPHGPGGPLYVIERTVLSALAYLFHARCAVLGTDSTRGRAEAQLALMLHAVVWRLAPEEVPHEVRATAAAVDVPAVEDLGSATVQALELFGHWQATGNEAALEETISIWRRAADVLPSAYPGRAMMLSNLGSALRFRYTMHGTHADLEEGLALGHEAVRSAEPSDPNLGMYLTNLSGSLSVRYGVRQDPADLDAAVETSAEAVRVAPQPHALFHSNAGIALLLRYERTSVPADLDAAADAFRLAVRHTAPDDPQRPMYMANLGRALHQRFERHGRKTDIDAAVDAARQAVDACPPSHPARHGCLSGLSNILRSQADLTGAPAALDAAVDAGRRALAAVPATSPDRSGVAESLALALRRRFRWLNRRADIDEAVALLRDSAHDGSPPEHFYNLGGVLLTRFRYAEDRADADAAVAAARQAVRVATDGTTGEGVVLTLLGEALHARSVRTSSPDDNEEAVAVLRRARTLLTGFHPTAVSKCLSELGLAHMRRFEITGSTADLDEAVDVCREAVRHNPDAPEQLIDESHLGGTLMLRYSHTGNPDDLAEAMLWNRRALDRLPHESSPYAGQVLFNLGRALQAVHQQNDDLGALDEAVRRLEGALRAGQSVGSRHRSGRDRAKQLSNLGAALRVRAERLGTRADLDRSIELSRQAIDALPADHPERATYFTNLCTTLLVRYTWAGDQQDLAEAVRTGQQAVEATAPADTSARVVHLTNLGIALRRRYEWSGALADLDEAIEACRAAVAALPPGHVDASLHRSNLSVALISRYERTGAATDLNEAVDASRAAADGVTDDHPQRAMHLSNLALALRHRYDGEGRRADADETVDRLQHAVRLCPAGHPQRPVYLANLAMALMARSGAFDPAAAAADADDAAEASLAARAALRAIPEHHPQRVMCLSNLGSALVIRASVEQDEEEAESDLRTAFDMFRQATAVTAAPAFSRFRAAHAWATASAAVGDWTESLDAHRAATAELPLMAWHGLDRRDRLDALGRAAGLAGEAAAVALNCGRPYDALRLLEQGRGVLLAQALDARDEMTELHERAPHLADRIHEIRALLETPAPEPGPESTAEPGRLLREQRRAAERRRELTREMDELTARARELPGLEDFLRLPSMDRLRTAAANGPVVVVNTSALRCDALVVTHDDLHTVPLPELHLAGDDGLTERAMALLDALATAGRSPADAWRAQRHLIRTLGWLWDTVAGPVLAALDHTVPDTRLWWCPTGLLSLLPLHAAGHYARDDPGDRSLPDRYICSYTTTLRALATQTHGARGTAPTARLLAVDQSDTPGLPPLPHAREEVRQLSSRLPHATVLTGSQGSRAALLNALPTHAYLHFSGHGTQDPTDSASGALYLHDHEQAGPLTVADISRLRLRNARLAFLSACETARGAAVLPDEAVHLAGALQVAGFAHVVAAQWVVDDTCALRVAEAFYTGLRSTTGLDPTRAARALHEAVRQLRQQNGDPLWWAAYVHTGP